MRVNPRSGKASDIAADSTIYTAVAEQKRIKQTTQASHLSFCRWSIKRRFRRASFRNRWKTRNSSSSQLCPLQRQSSTKRIVRSRTATEAKWTPQHLLRAIYTTMCFSLRSLLVVRIDLPPIRRLVASHIVIYDMITDWQQVFLRLSYLRTIRRSFFQQKSLHDSIVAPDDSRLLLDSALLRCYQPSWMRAKPFIEKTEALWDPNFDRYFGRRD